jgi:hypothetical protein
MSEDRPRLYPDDAYPIPRAVPLREIEVRVPGRPPGANELIRMHYHAIAKTRAEWKRTMHHVAVQDMARGPFAREWMLTAIGGSGRNPDSTGYVDPAAWWPLSRVSVGIEWRCKTKRRRDFDNLVSGLKPLLDGLVSSGILEDDSSDVIVALGPLTIVVGAREDETVLRIREVARDES